jgi:hypothetical protein
VSDGLTYSEILEWVCRRGHKTNGPACEKTCGIVVNEICRRIREHDRKMLEKHQEDMDDAGGQIIDLLAASKRCYNNARLDALKFVRDNVTSEMGWWDLVNYEITHLESSTGKK